MFDKSVYLLARPHATSRGPMGILRPAPTATPALNTSDSTERIFFDLFQIQCHVDSRYVKVTFFEGIICRNLSCDCN